MLKPMLYLAPFGPYGYLEHSGTSSPLSSVSFLLDTTFDLSAMTQCLYFFPLAILEG